MQARKKRKVDNGESGDDITTRPKRKRVTSQQLAILEPAFEENDTPDYDTREGLAAQTGMTNREVQVWAQNRRAKRTRLANAAAAANLLQAPSASQAVIPSFRNDAARQPYATSSSVGSSSRRASGTSTQSESSPGSRKERLPPAELPEHHQYSPDHSRVPSPSTSMNRDRPRPLDFGNLPAVHLPDWPGHYARDRWQPPSDLRSSSSSPNLRQIQSAPIRQDGANSLFFTAQSNLVDRPQLPPPLTDHLHLLPSSPSYNKPAWLPTPDSIQEYRQSTYFSSESGRRRPKTAEERRPPSTTPSSSNTPYGSSAKHALLQRGCRKYTSLHLCLKGTSLFILIAAF